MPASLSYRPCWLYGFAMLRYCLRLSFSLFLYWACCTIFSLLAFSIFRLEHKGLRYFSVDDIFDIAKAVVVAELLTAAILVFIYPNSRGFHVRPFLFMP